MEPPQAGRQVATGLAMINRKVYTLDPMKFAP
jgi:hypothetical protein